MTLFDPSALLPNKFLPPPIGSEKDSKTNKEKESKDISSSITGTRGKSYCISSEPPSNTVIHLRPTSPTVPKSLEKSSEGSPSSNVDTEAFSEKSKQLKALWDDSKQEYENAKEEFHKCPNRNLEPLISALYRQMEDLKALIDLYTDAGQAHTIGEITTRYEELEKEFDFLIKNEEVYQCEDECNLAELEYRQNKTHANALILLNAIKKYFEAAKIATSLIDEADEKKLNEWLDLCKFLFDFFQEIINEKPTLIPDASKWKKMNIDEEAYYHTETGETINGRLPIAEIYKEMVEIQNQEFNLVENRNKLRAEGQNTESLDGQLISLSEQSKQFTEFIKVHIPKPPPQPLPPT